MPWKAWVVAIAIGGAAFAAGRTDAAPKVAHLNWGSQLNPSDCPDDGYRYLEVNITGQVSNDADQLPAPTIRRASGLVSSTTATFKCGRSASHRRR